MSDSEKLPQPASAVEMQTLAQTIKRLAQDYGFQQAGISQLDVAQAYDQLEQWLAKNYHGEMDYMARNTEMRADPTQLVPGTLSIISLRMDYLVDVADAEQVMNKPEQGFISRYALGRDYHKLIRKRLQQLAKHIEQLIGPMGYRVFTDSAPVLEKSIATNAGLGWLGKHSNIINQKAGSWFFLGEIFVDLALPADSPVKEHCGKCTDCIDICPTQAIVAPYQVDARRCISYLTIELKGAIPEELRPMMGNRIYGCDDCQLVCPWNRFARYSAEQDFLPRHNFDAPQLVELFLWQEDEFLKKTEGSPIRRIGHERWLRNIAVALGNGSKTKEIVQVLQHRSNHSSALVQEHAQWALKNIDQNKG